jgi:ribosomal protein S6
LAETDTSGGVRLLGVGVSGLSVYAQGDQGAAVSSGSFVTMGMIVLPCSMRTLGTIAHGVGETLIPRAADVVLKERRRLVLGNGDVRISYVAAGESSPLYRNAIGDECVYVESGGGTWDLHDVWGRRKLAYEIDHKPDGAYHLLTFSAEPEALAEVSRVLRITDGVMRHMAVRRPETGHARPMAPSEPRSQDVAEPVSVASEEE